MKLHIIKGGPVFHLKNSVFIDPIKRNFYNKKNNQIKLDYFIKYCEKKQMPNEIEKLIVDYLI